MKIFIILLAITLASCGDNNKAAGVADAPAPDAFCSSCPPPPAIGPQMDRMGRPAINTTMNHSFDGTAAAGPAKNQYNTDSSPGGWGSAYIAQFMVNLAIIDFLDAGLACTDGACGAGVGGCGNQVEYNGTVSGGGVASATSYATLAGLLADDRLYLDTTKASCELLSHANYLAVEFNVVTGLDNVTCGGRAPTNDVIDTSYTAIAIGTSGFKLSDKSYTAAFGDDVGPHRDVSNDNFPFLGVPHAN